MPQRIKRPSIQEIPSLTQSFLSYNEANHRRLIGRRFDDPDVTKDRKQWPFAVIDNGEGAPLVEVDYLGEKKKFTPQEISSMVLLKMKQISEAKYVSDI
jgi:heat shock 70kDa protein 1/2/6/8